MTTVGIRFELRVSSVTATETIQSRSPLKNTASQRQRLTAGSGRVGSTSSFSLSSRGQGYGLDEFELAVLDLHPDPVAVAEPALQHRHREPVLEQALDGPLQRPGAVGRVPAALGQERLGLLGQLQLDLAFRQPAAERLQLDVDDRLQLFAGQRLEHDHLVDAVQELGAEVLNQHAHDAVPDLVEGLAGELLDDLAAEVGGHDQDRVPEVDGAALAVGQAAVVEDLEQDVEDVRVRLFNLVEEDHGEWAPAHRLGELAALVVADVARRRTDQPGHRVALLVLRHVEPDQCLLVVEEELREGARQLRLADAGRAQEDEGADRALGVREAGAGPAD